MRAEPPLCAPGTAAAFLLGAALALLSVLPVPLQVAQPYREGDLQYFQRNNEATHEGSISQTSRNVKKSHEPFTDNGWSGLGLQLL